MPDMLDLFPGLTTKSAEIFSRLGGDGPQGATAAARLGFFHNGSS